MRLKLIVLLALLVWSSITFPSFGQVGSQELEKVLLLEAEADSYTDSAAPTFNFGASAELIVSLDERTGNRKISYLKFEISEFNVTGLVSASLNLHLKRKASFVTSQIALHLVNSSDWEELRINGLNAPVLGNQTSVNDTVGFVNAWHSWNIATEISSLFESENRTIAFAMVPLAPTGDDVFSSKDSNLEPFIEIRYTEVVSDALPPLFHQITFTPNQPSVEDEVEVSVELSDDSGISNVLLHFIRDSEVDWSIREMELRDGAYFRSIPRQPSNSSIFFFIQAFDTVGNSNSTRIYSFTISRPNYYIEIQKELDETKAFYENLLANTSRQSEIEFNNAVTSLQLEISRLTSDLEKLLADYELLLLDNTQVDRERNDLEQSYQRVQALYNSLRAQYGNIEIAFEGQQADEETLRAQLEDLQRTYSELNREYEESLSRINSQEGQIGLYSLISIGVAAGFGLVAVTSFSLWYFGRKSIHT